MAQGGRGVGGWKLVLFGVPLMAPLDKYGCVGSQHQLGQ